MMTMAELRVRRWYIRGEGVEHVPRDACPACYGGGEVDSDVACETCGGTGNAPLRIAPESRDGGTNDSAD